MPNEQSVFEANRLKVFFRSLLIQAGWNFEKLQNLGFAYTVLPVLSALYKGQELVRAQKRSLETFNTQPFMASFILGFTSKLEETCSVSDESERAYCEVHIAMAKSAMGTASAAIGDRLFWGTLRAFTLLMAMAFVWPSAVFSPGHVFWKPGYLSAVSGLALSVCVYNLFSIYVRWQGLVRGYNCTMSAGCGIDLINWQKLIRQLRLVGFALAIVLLIFWGVEYVVSLARLSMNRELAAFMAMGPLSFILMFPARRKGYLAIYLYFAIIVLSASLFFVF